MNTMEFTTYTWTTHDSQPGVTTHVGVERDGTIYHMLVEWPDRSMVTIIMHQGFATVEFSRKDGVWMEKEGPNEWTTAHRRDLFTLDQVESLMCVMHARALARMTED